MRLSVFTMVSVAGVLSGGDILGYGCRTRLSIPRSDQRSISSDLAGWFVAGIHGHVTLRTRVSFQRGLGIQGGFGIQDGFGIHIHSGFAVLARCFANFLR